MPRRKAAPAVPYRLSSPPASPQRKKRGEEAKGEQKPVAAPIVNERKQYLATIRPDSPLKCLLTLIIKGSRPDNPFDINASLITHAFSAEYDLGELSLHHNISGRDLKCFFIAVIKGCNDPSLTADQHQAWKQVLKLLIFAGNDMTDKYKKLPGAVKTVIVGARLPRENSLFTKKAESPLVASMIQEVSGAKPVCEVMTMQSASWLYNAVFWAEWNLVPGPATEKRLRDPGKGFDCYRDADVRERLKYRLTLIRNLYKHLIKCDLVGLPDTQMPRVDLSVKQLTTISGYLHKIAEIASQPIQAARPASPYHVHTFFKPVFDDGLASCRSGASEPPDSPASTDSPRLWQKKSTSAGAGAGSAPVSPTRLRRSSLHL